MKRIVAAVVLIVAVIPLLSCNTVQGIGRDIEKGVKAIERAATR